MPASLILVVTLLLGFLVSGCRTPSCCAQSQPPKRVLVVTTTTGFRHSSIETAERVIARLGAQSGSFTVDYARVSPNAPELKGADGQQDKAKYEAAVQAVLAEKLSVTALQNYDAVIFANTTGDLPIPDLAGFLAWIRAGKAFVGMHAAADTFHGFPAFIEMLGGEFKTHGRQVSVEAINLNPACAACRHLPPTWTVFDEIYQFKNYDRDKVRDLLSLDKHPNDKTPGHYPVAWAKLYGKGRVFYTSLGHREDVWEPNSPAQPGGIKNAPVVAEAYQKHILGGIQWALGLAPCDLQN
ncbi:MAG TPA: ThuA domain-containing protein [Verrucomicrobiota bacterium]|nr:ThuA domain-containing protein [Verrucomicrobiota bacterium]HNT15021.1 ThuA domain-containing protein [Verrucomicrobiota bacterium]